LTDLEQRLRPVGTQERETLLKLKADELKAKGEPFDGEFYIWDYRYYDRLYIENTLSLDDGLVKEYFPVSVVVPAILEIYQNLLGVRFNEVKDAQTWHPDAQMFAVWAADAKDESDFVGYCYLDLFPRGASPCLYAFLPSSVCRAYCVIRIQVWACGCLVLAPWLHAFGWQGRISSNRDGRKPCSIYF
jgi:Peptidase family M3